MVHIDPGSVATLGSRAWVHELSSKKICRKFTPNEFGFTPFDP